MRTRLLSSVVPTTKASTWPLLMAWRRSSASWSWWRSDWIWFSISYVLMAWFMFPVLGFLPELQADKRPFGVGEVADDLAYRVGELAHQRRDGDDLVVLGKPRVLQEVDHLDLVAPGEVLLAHLLQVLDRSERFRRLAGGVQAQRPLFCAARVLGVAVLAAAHFRFLLATSAPRRVAAAARLSLICCSRARAYSATTFDSSSTASYSLRSAAICPSSAARLRSRSRCLRSISCARATAAAFSRSSCAARIDPVSTPSGPT